MHWYPQTGQRSEAPEAANKLKESGPGALLCATFQRHSGGKAGYQGHKINTDWKGTDLPNALFPSVAASAVVMTVVRRQGSCSACRGLRAPSEEEQDPADLLGAVIWGVPP